MLKKKKQEEKKPQHKINWYEDKYQSVLVWRNWLFTLTIVSLIGIVAVCGALYFMLPLKSVAPFVIQIDEKTGISEVVENRTAREYAANEMLIKYFSMQYISARENYDIDVFKFNTQIIHSMSSNDVYNVYLSDISQENPESPLNKYSFNATRSIDLISFSILSKTETGESIVQARLRVRELSSTGGMKEYYSIITMTCYFSDNVQINEKGRLINPLGFIVTSYKSDEEIQGGRE
jgi:type IV secretion system protein VirB8